MTLFILYLVINSVISLNWSVSNVELPYELQGAVGSVYNNYVSILGGYYLQGGMIINDKTYKYPIDAILSFANHSNTIEWISTTTSFALGGQQSQFVVFDDMIYVYTHQLNIYNLRDDSFTDISYYEEHSMIGFSGAGDCVVGINEYIFIIGGYTGSDHTQAIKNTQIYDINNDDWLLLDAYSMHIARGYHTCVYSTVDSNIYVISGLTGNFNDDIYTKSIETFHFTSNEWNTEGWKIQKNLSLEVGLRCMMSVEYHNYIYLFGGLYASWSDLAEKYDNKVLNVVIRLDVTTQTMIYDSALPRYTFWAPIIIHNNKLYVFGGWGLPNDVSFETAIQIAEFSETFLNIDAISSNIISNISQNIKTPTTNIDSDDNKSSHYNLIPLWVFLAVAIFVFCIILFRNRNRNKNKGNHQTKNEHSHHAAKEFKKPQMEMEPPTLNVNENDDQFCVICMDALTTSGKIGKLECGHKFHNKCLIEWIESNPTCPLCRIPCTTMSFI